MMYQAVPVIMYHSIGIANKNWRARHLTCPWELFQQHLTLMRNKKIDTITLQELYEYINDGVKPHKHPIVLTFDDGYVDNWVFAYPLLKKYGFKGTIFINPEFVDSRSIVRKNLSDVWNHKENIGNLQTSGFLSWEEIKIMESEAVMDIQSHSMSHTWYFTGDEIIDFHHPGNTQYPWLFWNTRPERKSYYLNENQEHFVPYGTPIYENGRSLGVKRYFEDAALSKYLTAFVKNQGDGFFTDKDWRNTLLQQVHIYKAKNKLNDRYETDEEQKERYRYELIKSKDILEDKLNKKINFLCWAGGAFNSKALSIAQEAGYLSSTLSYNDSKIKNTFGDDPSIINRTGAVSEFIWHNEFISYTDPGYFMANIKYFCGEKIYLWIIRVYKIKYLAKFIIRKLLKRGEMQ